MADENTSDPGATGSGSDATNEPSEPPTPATEGEASSESALGAMTPGQRLAAKKALKATQKREFKEELKRKEEEDRQKELAEAERILGRAPVEPVLPQNVERVAGKFTTFLQEQRARILAGVALVVVAAGAVMAFQRFVHSGNAEQAAELARAVELSNAPIDAEGRADKSDDGEPSFASESERASKAAAAFADAAKTDEKSTAAGWAKLGQAATLVAAGKFSEAEALYRTAASHEGDAQIRARALEGTGIALEAQGKQDDAHKAFEQLKAIESEKQLAEYHLARLALAKGDRDGAKATLKALYDQLNAVREDGAPSPFLKAEVELRLAELDSSLVDQGSSAQQPQQFSEEQLQRLLQQLQQGKAPGTGE